MDSLKWTGSNVKQMREFSDRAGFGFIVGSTLHRERWWHKMFNWISHWIPGLWNLEWVPEEDLTVLEVHRHPNVVIARLGDVVHEDGTVSTGA